MTTPKRSEYESIPDVETGDRKISVNDYSDLDPRQQKLFMDLDDAIAFSDLQFDPPDFAADIVIQGQSFFVGVIQPTLMALFQVGLAFYLEKEQQLSSIAASLVVFFPYIGAFLEFLSSIQPTQKRIIETTSPVFDHIDKGADAVNTHVAKLQPHVDKMVKYLRKATHEVLEPIEPTLSKANKVEFMLKKIDPKVDIPDTSDIDKLFDKAEAGVSFKIKEAQTKMDLRQYIPPSLKSPSAFYWRIVFPVLCLAFVVQMLAAFCTDQLAGFAFPGGPAKFIDTEKLHEGWVSFENTVQTDTESAKQYLHQVKGEVADEWHNIDSNMDDYKLEMEVIASDSRRLLVSIAVSYLIALIQLLVSNMVTNKENRRKLIKRVVARLTKSAQEYLQEKGVTTLFHDVLGVNMGTVKAKVLKAIRAERRLKLLIAKIGGDNAVTAAESAQNLNQDKPNIFQKIFFGK